MRDKRYTDIYALPETKMIRVCMTRYGQHPSDVITMLRLQGMHQYEIAADLGVSLSTVRHWQRPEVGGTIYGEAHRERSRELMTRLNDQMRRGELKRARTPWRKQRLFSGSR